MFASRAAVRHFVRRETSRCGIIRTFANLDQFNDFGKHVFTGKVADQYLAKHGGSGDMLKDPTWVKKHSDTVAMAVFDWYVVTRGVRIDTGR
jgi:glutamine synthetase